VQRIKQSKAKIKPKYFYRPDFVYLEKSFQFIYTIQLAVTLIEGLSKKHTMGSLTENQTKFSVAGLLTFNA